MILIQVIGYKITFLFLMCKTSLVCMIQNILAWSS